MGDLRKSYDYGLWAETVAALWLCLKGYKILRRRYKTPVGEIDIIARRKNHLAIVEVKARAAVGDALEAVRPQGRRRIEKAARYFLAAHPLYVDFSLSFDVVAVSGAISVLHLDNAWFEGQ
ncbi:MAG: YraN family protein [Alphaproteobacteria bacterium]|nr:YraN family protein [Alphaproteobacteria bacterium]